MAAASAIPFRWITGLPHEAQREIERDFLHIEEEIRAIPASSSIGRHDFQSTLGSSGAIASAFAAQVFWSGAATISGTSITQATTAVDASNGANIITAGAYVIDAVVSIYPDDPGDSMLNYTFGWTDSALDPNPNPTEQAPALPAAVAGVWVFDVSRTVWLPAGSLNLSAIAVANTVGGLSYFCDMQFRLTRVV